MLRRRAKEAEAFSEQALPNSARCLGFISETHAVKRVAGQRRLWPFRSVGNLPLSRIKEGRPSPCRPRQNLSLQESPALGRVHLVAALLLGPVSFCGRCLAVSENVRHLYVPVTRVPSNGASQAVVSTPQGLLSPPFSLSP